MSQQTRMTIKLIALMIVLTAMGMHLGVVNIPVLQPYDFWLVVVSFAVLFFSN